MRFTSGCRTGNEKVCVKTSERLCWSEDKITGGDEFERMEKSPLWISKYTRKIIAVVVDSLSMRLRPSSNTGK